MTASPFTITPTPPTSLKLEVGQDGTFSFTVTSLAAPDSSQDLILEAQVLGPDGKGKAVDWLTVGPARSLTLTGGETATVTIAARPRSTSPLGEHRIQLAVADNERPHDVYEYSAPVSCEVTGKPVAVPPRRLPKWLIPVIVGGVLVVGLNIFLIAKLVGGDDDDGVGKACTSQAECASGLICADAHRCLRPGGAACKDSSVCASADCVSRLELCAVPLGLACNPGDKVPCPQLSTCDPSKRICLGGVGARCTTNAQCETGQCAAGTCTTVTSGSFTVVLINAGANKIEVIKVVREVTGIGLKEAKDLVESAPTNVKVTVLKTEAIEIVRRLRGAGAEADIQ